MDKKKALTLFLLLLSATCLSPAFAQSVAQMEFCDRSYEYGVGNDSIHLFFNLRAEDNKRIPNLTQSSIEEMLLISEDGKDIGSAIAKKLDSGIRIPKEYTFSIVLDQSIPLNGKMEIWKVLEDFVNMAPDSTVYISYYGEGVSNSLMAHKDNLEEIKDQYFKPTEGKSFYSAVYAKLTEFSPEDAHEQGKIKSIGDYQYSQAISRRAKQYADKKILMLFAEGSTRPDDEDLYISHIVDLQTAFPEVDLPKVFAFYYTQEGEDTYIETTLQVISEPRDSDGRIIRQLRGAFHPSSSMQDVTSQFQSIVDDAAYDYEFVYKATNNKAYMGNVDYVAKWGPKREIGHATYAIGSAENPWPTATETSFAVKILVAILVTLLTFGFFFAIMKIVVPYLRSLTFKRKFYREYQQENNVQRRICHYCKQDIRPGQKIVTKCNHWMHEHCWKENGYKCAEYGQNCKNGIQEHIEWKDLFKWSTLKGCTQTLSGILAGFVSWIIYSLCLSGGVTFTSLSEVIVGLVLDASANVQSFQDCVYKTSSFLLIGLLLGFFISLVFRYNDEVKDKTWKVWLKITGLSVLTGIIGMVAFAIGADIFCLMYSWTDSMAWYCSLPAYILFSLSVSLALTVKSSIPVKSALIGGCCASVIGFIVLYISHFVSAKYSYVPMLLDFIIYGGGLGASLITVRMLAERYFLVIQNGVKAGQRIPIHKWMNATGGGNKVSIGMTGDCEIQMNWEKSNKVAKEHAQLFIDHDKMLPVIKPLAIGVVYNNRADLPVSRHCILSNGDTFMIGETIFKYEEA